MKRLALFGIVLSAALLAPLSALAQPPAQGPGPVSCTRGGLQNAVDLYIDAQTKGDKSILPLPNGMGYWENAARFDIEQGIINKAMEIDHHRSHFDEATCQTFTEVIVTDDAEPYVLGTRMRINHDKIDKANHKILSNASCTTNCLTPVAKVLLENFGIKRGLMTTIHAYTNDQNILDLPHKDLRRARAAALSMIPSTTGAAKAVAEVIPELKGKLHGTAVRVPTPNVSLVDLTFQSEKPMTVDSINAAFKKAAEGNLKGVLHYSAEQTVSVDYNHNPHSSIFDSTNTMMVGGDDFAKVSAWYDNEWGFSNRMVDVAKLLTK